MTNQVLLKRSSVANSVPSSGSLEYGELALNYTDGNLFFKDAGNVVTTLASTQFVNVTGNVTGNNFIGNGSYLTGINVFSSLVVPSQGTIVANGISDSLTFEGSGVTILTDVANNTVTFSADNSSTVKSAIFGDGGPMGLLTDPVNSSGDIGTILSVPTVMQDLGTLTEAASLYYPLTTSGNVTAGGNVVSTGNIISTSGYFIGDGSQLTNVAATSISANNLTGTTLSSNVINSSLTSVGTLGSLTVTGNIVSGNVSGTLLTGTLTTAVQPNVTSVGTLTSLDVTGNVSAGNVSGTNLTGTLTTAAQPNVTSVGTLASLDVAGNVSAGNVSGTNGTFTNVYGTLGTAAQTNITSLGNLTSLTVVGPIEITGNINQTGNLNITGNINATGNLNYDNVTDLVVGDPLIQLGANNSGNLFDLGFVVAWDDGLYQHGGFVRDASDGIWKVFGNVIPDPTTTVDFTNAIYQPLQSGAFYATTGTFSGNVSAGNVSGTLLSGTLTTAAQPNVTSVGTLTSLDVSGNANVGNIGSTNVIATNVIATNVIATSLTGTLTTAAQPNVTSVGTLTSLDVTGNVSTGNVLGNIGTFTTVAGTLTTAAQPNVTSVGTLTSLDVTGNATTGNILTTNGVFSGSLSGITTISANGNASVGNLTSSGNISANYITGNGSGLSGINAFSTISVFGQNNVVADSLSDTLTFYAGAGMSITTDDSSDTITFSSTSDIWITGGTMGLVTQTPAVFYDFGNITSISTTDYNLGGLIVDGVVINSTILNNEITGDKFANNIEISTSGNISASGLAITGNTATVTSSNYQIGYLQIPQIILGSNLVLDLTAGGKHYYSTTAGNIILTIPSSSNVDFPLGTAVEIVLQAVGNILVETQPGVNLYLSGNSTTGNRVVSSYGTAKLLKVATDTWFISGTGVV